MTEKQILKEDIKVIVEAVREMCKMHTDCDYCQFNNKVCSRLHNEPSSITDREIEEVLR